MEIVEYSAEKVKDPFGILEGDRYEFRLIAEVDEDDELFSPEGLYIRVLLAVEGETKRITGLFLHNRADDRILDFELEEDEEKLVYEYCMEHLPSA